MQHTVSVTEHPHQASGRCQLISQRVHCCRNTSLDSFQTTRLLLNYATSLTSGKWPLRKESKFIRFSWILVKPMIEYLHLAYCSSYRIWVFQTLQWMSSFLMDRQQRVRVNGCLSTSKSPKSGIPQGTVLGPVLFLVYINDLPCSISSDCSIFADDTSVYNTGSKPPSICSMLSKDRIYAADWAAEWGMLFNAEKSEHLAISTRKSDITNPHVTMNGTQIPQVTSHKHLGVNFNNTLSWQQHVDNVSTSCARRIGIIRQLRRKLHSVVLKRIYLGAVLPKLEYACLVWCGGPTQKLIKMHANFCRRNGTALPSLQTRFDYHTLVMFYKIHTRQATSYLTSLLPPLSSRSGYTFRKFSYRFPTVSRTSTLNSFLPQAVALWNAFNIPTNVQRASSIYAFKKLSNPILKYKPSTILFRFLFCSSFLDYFFFCFFFLSLPFLLVMSYTSHLQERSPTSNGLLFLQSCLNICLWSVKSESQNFLRPFCPSILSARHPLIHYNRAPLVWNSLPASIKQASTMPLFKSEYLMLLSNSRDSLKHLELNW